MTAIEQSAAAVAYIRYVLKYLGLTPSALARKAKVSSSTLTRALNNPRYRFTLSLSTLKKIADETGVSYIPFLESEDLATLNIALNHDARMFDSSKWEEIPTENQEYAPVIGEVAIGEWKEIEAYDEYDLLPAYVRLSFHAPKDSFTVHVKGDSANAVAEDGEMLLCYRVRNTSDLPDPDLNLVIVERRHENGALIELSLRLALRLGENGTWDLRGFSRDKRFQTSVMSRLDGSDGTRLLGVVSYVIREIRGPIRLERPPPKN